MKKKLLVMMIILILALSLSGCMPGNEKYLEEPANFLSGIWHGWIAPISLIVGLGNKDVRVYEVLNTGWWYDLGFYMAIISGFGGLSIFRKRREND